MVQTSARGDRTEGVAARVTQASPEFTRPPVLTTAEGAVRRVGFEVEFSGLSLQLATETVKRVLEAQLGESTAAESTLVVEELGEFKVEVDWAFLKKLAKDHGEAGDPQWLEHLSRAAATLVPIEVVCPPIAMDRLGVLDDMVAALREAGAIGTEESLIAAYGVHVNSEIPALDADTIGRYLRAFCLLQWWLVDAHEVDPARKISPYIDLYPRTYLAQVLARKSMSLDDIFSDYLEHNCTRNRALDMLPILAEIDPQRIRREVDDPRVNARPAFHYRMPNCQIERENWGLRNSWAIWCVVEQLADRPADLKDLSQRFLDSQRPLLDVDRGRWVNDMDAWLKDRGLV